MSFGRHLKEELYSYATAASERQLPGNSPVIRNNYTPMSFESATQTKRHLLVINDHICFRNRDRASESSV